mmetsp:Transcript_15693/g.39772  ORF Transcript_15693/g.39772 Transcript_15693/m.39772 type:complete len:204 (-) Transcript_15693:410-1021(-)
MWNVAYRDTTPNTVIPTTIIPEKPPARRATCSASRAVRRAAPETRTFARTLTHMPTYPATPEQRAPSRNEKVVMTAMVNCVIPALCCSGVTCLKRYTTKMMTETIDAYLAMFPYCVAKNPSAPSRMASETSFMSGVPSSLLSTHCARCAQNPSMTMHMSMTTRTVVLVFSPANSMPSSMTPATAMTARRSQDASMRKTGFVDV